MAVPTENSKANRQVRDECELSWRVAENLDQKEASRYRGTPQVIIAWTYGVVIVEAPGAGGRVRTKIEGVTFDDLPAPIQAALIAQRDDNKRREIPVPAPKREDAQSVRERRIAGAREAHRREWQTQFDNATPDVQAEMLRKRELARERQETLDRERAHQVWLMTASSHDIPLANHVVDDPNRRPRRKVIVIGSDGTRRELSPRNTNSNSSKKPTKKVDLSLAVDIKL